ncbi:hypothetical protein ACFTWF_02900 [Rhodococcus sp. NPDC056960]|uniref:hypothetical protein n=1 Tax=Rhodococcus sp. NPDC056960 TaxID=3345982 RepID=UPI003633EF5E
MVQQPAAGDPLDILRKHHRQTDDNDQDEPTPHTETTSHHVSSGTATPLRRNYAAVEPFRSSFSAIHTLISDCRVTPRRVASSS